MTAVDVVVVAYRSRDLLERLVPEVRAATTGRLVVVDNGDDGSADLAEVLGAVGLRRPDNPGFGAGQNAGVAYTTTELVLLLNPDARLDPVGLTAGVAHLERNPEVGAVQGAVVNDRTGLAERSQGRELGPAHLLGRALGLRRLAGLGPVRAVVRRTRLRDYVDREVAEPVEVASLAATVLLVRRAALDQIGGFDEGYFLYGEDLDLCRRLREAGWRLVALPDTFAVHAGGASSESWRRRELEWWRGTMRFAARWWTGPAWAGALVAAGVRWIGLALLQPRGSTEAWRATVGDARRARRERR